MTREEVINHLTYLKNFFRVGSKQYITISMVIEALKQESCTDCISRQYLLDSCVVDKVTMPYVPISKIENAPSVTPQPKTDILDKIKKDIYNACSDIYHMPVYNLDYVQIFEIIDRYKTESEAKK